MTIVIIRKFATRVRNHLQRIISSTERDKYKEEVYEVVMNNVSNKRYPEKSTRPIGIIHPNIPSQCAPPAKVRYLRLGNGATFTSKEPAGSWRPQHAGRWLGTMRLCTFSPANLNSHSGRFSARLSLRGPAEISNPVAYAPAAYLSFYRSAAEQGVGVEFRVVRCFRLSLLHPLRI